MCGILVYKEKGNNTYIRRRGQDFTNRIERHGFTFVHNLLSITGKFTPQPYEDDDIVCLYNGEIYNHKFVRSDGENLIPLYKKYGIDFPKYLDGEWAIALYDFKEKIAVFSTDLFATKPIWRNGLECASYHSGVEGKKIAANTIEVIDFKGRLKKKKSVYDWNFRQYKDHYEDWMQAFSRAIKKRAIHGCFLGLSSGYDSGAIACELLKQKFYFKAYLVKGKETMRILKERMVLLDDYEFIDPSQDTYQQERQWVKSNIEHFKYKVGEDCILEDSASYGLSIICRKAHEEGRKVYLSGQGADEIIGDYAFFPHQSCFGGIFPEKLSEWRNFTEGTQYSYLGKEEYVAGAHSIETRYPFLDRDVVQEFLWLSTDLKNSNYKAPIYEYLIRNHFPFEPNIKKGFSVIKR